MTNIAMENPNHKWRFLAGTIIYFYGPFSMAMSNNQRVSLAFLLLIIAVKSHIPTRYLYTLANIKEKDNYAMVTPNYTFVY